MTSVYEKSAHTPGPWEVQWEMGSGENHWIVPTDARDSRIAKVEVFAPTDGDMEAQGKANARLIAAAPEFLAALKQVRGYMDDPQRECPLPVEIASAVREALAKAEPRS